MRKDKRMKRIERGAKEGEKGEKVEGAIGREKEKGNKRGWERRGK